MLPLLLALIVERVDGVMFPGEDEACLRTEEPLVPCMLSGAVGWADSAATRDLHLDSGLVLVPESPEQLQPNIGDPRETRTLVEAVKRAFSRRRLIWELDWLYPGLAMLVSRGPDPRLYFAFDSRAQNIQHETTGRLLVKRAVVPVLLGVNLKLISLVPLLMAALVILAKKAFFLSKLSLLVSGLGLFRLSQQYQQQQLYQGHGGFGGNRANAWDWQNPDQPLTNFTNSFF